MAPHEVVPYCFMRDAEAQPQRQGDLPVTLIKRLTHAAMACAMLAGCAPTVEVKAPDKPIEITLNLNIKHEMRVKVEKAVEAAFSDSELFE